MKCGIQLNVLQWGSELLWGYGKRLENIIGSYFIGAL